MKKKLRSMAGTAYCSECQARAEHERGPGSPLSIRHDPSCSELRSAMALDAAELGSAE